jgi:hypothetical protein
MPKRNDDFSFNFTKKREPTPPPDQTPAESLTFVCNIPLPLRDSLQYEFEYS